MSIVRDMVQDISGGARPYAPGDLFLNAESLSASLATAGAGTILGSLFASGFLTRTGPGAGYTDTTDTAANIINALLAQAYIGGGALGGLGINPGSTFRWRFINTVAFAMTLAGGTGVTLGSNVNCAASSVKEYLITITNGTPGQSFVGSTTNASAVVTGMSAAQTGLLSVGMLVTGTGIPGSTTVLSVQPGVGVTLSANATATGTPVLTFSPTLTINSIGQMLL